MATFETVREIAREFPDVHETTMWGSPAIKLGKRLVACMATHKSAEPGSLVVRTDYEQRALFLSDDPETYYLKDHYVNYPVVLVRLARVNASQLRDILAAARQRILADTKKRSRSRR
jgi:hypothetical protein